MQKLMDRSPLDGSHERPALRTFLSEIRGEKVCYCPNPGNGGDSLIALATFQLFEELELDYQTVRWDEAKDLSDQIVIYAGGGNLVGIYKQARTFIERHHRNARRLILLPCTIRKNEDLLGQLGSHVDIICRERYSYEYVQEAAPAANVHIMDDVALNLDIQRVMEARRLPLWAVLSKSVWQEITGRSSGTPEEEVALRTLLRCLKDRVKAERGQRGDLRVLNCFRVDHEQTKITLPEDNVDISRIFSFGTHSPAVALYATRAFLDYVDRFEEVRTNRLHVCIGAALLGKSVHFYPNSYFKNQAVFEFSLRSHFEKVKWIGA